MTERLRGRKLQERRRRWFAENPLCAHCDAKGQVTAASELDHIKPLFKGGDDLPSNWQGLCQRCHATKTAQDAGLKSTRIGTDGWPEPMQR